LQQTKLEHESDTKLSQKLKVKIKNSSKNKNKTFNFLPDYRFLLLTFDLLLTTYDF